MIYIRPCSRRTQTLWLMMKRGSLFVQRLRNTRRFRMRSRVTEAHAEEDRRPVREKQVWSL